MLFNSIDFAVFLPLVFLLYWWVGGRSIRRRNIILLLSSYIFYGWWDPRFLLLIAFSTVVDFAVGLAMEGTLVQRRRKYLLWTSLVVNIGLLGYFKYANFLLDSFVGAFTFFGGEFHADRLDIILPVGISFYTFQTLSYSIDVYHRRMRPISDPIAFAAYVSFFPQLVAGPIERAINLLPQFQELRKFDTARAVDGSRQMLWGFFKKLVIADNCAEEVERIFGAHMEMSGATLLLGTVFFSMQAYGDFSGYSDIAIGCARLFGFNLQRNFAYPFFARDIAEFWRRWHISLTTWFRDYVYIPMGGSRGTKAMQVRNISVVFLISGLWHGAAWHFVIYGALNALYFIPGVLRGTRSKRSPIVAQGRLRPSLVEVVQMGRTFLLASLTFTVLRAEDMRHATEYLIGIFDTSLFQWPDYHHAELPWLITACMALEWVRREDEHTLQRLGNALPRIWRWSIFALIACTIGFFMNTNGTPFFYFQF
ncbi:MAG: MBOAT family protein [Flavobacteriales bacterium]|nr:MBOAT family protein [Flavobacteriales bacterium]